MTYSLFTLSYSHINRLFNALVKSNTILTIPAKFHHQTQPNTPFPYFIILNSWISAFIIIHRIRIIFLHNLFFFFFQIFLIFHKSKSSIWIINKIIINNILKIWTYLRLLLYTGWLLKKHWINLGFNVLLSSTLPLSSCKQLRSIYFQYLTTLLQTLF